MQLERERRESSESHAPLGRHEAGAPQWRLSRLCPVGAEGAGAPHAHVLILQPGLLLCPQLRPRWLPRGPCPTQGPSCSTREQGLGLSSRPGPKAQEFVIKTEKTKKRNQDSPTPRVGRGDSNSCSFTDELSFPRLHQDTSEPRSSPLLSSPLARQPHAPGCQRKRRAAQQQLPSTWAGTSGPHRVDCRSGSTMVSRSGDSM